MTVSYVKCLLVASRSFLCFGLFNFPARFMSVFNVSADILSVLSYELSYGDGMYCSAFHSLHVASSK